MYICFVCNNGFETIELLRIHFKYLHLLKNVHKYKCCQGKCFQKFTHVRSLITHLKSHKIQTKTYFYV